MHLRRFFSPAAIALLVVCASSISVAAPVKISPALTSSGTIIGYSPDGLRAVYANPYAAGQTNNLYSVRVDGSDAAAPVQLNTYSLVHPVGNTIKITPDGRISYLADDHTVNPGGTADLFTNSISGGSPQQLTTGKALSPRGDEDGIGNPAYQTSPSGASLSYFAFDANNRNAVYVVPNGGGASTKVTPTYTNSQGDASNMRWVGNDTIIYRADGDKEAMYELYAVSATGGAPTKINFNLGAADAGGTGFNPSVKTNFFISPDAARVIYMADPSHTVGVNSSFPYNVYSAPVAGGTSTQLNPANTNVSTARNIALAGSSVVFQATSTLDSSSAVYVAPTAPPVGWAGPTRLTDVGQVAAGFSIAPAGDRVVYWTGPTANKSDPYAVATSGGSSVRLNDTTYSDYVAAQYVNSLGTLFSNDGNAVFYGLRCWGTPFDRGSVWKASLVGNPNPTRLTPDGIDVDQILGMSPDGKWISFYQFNTAFAYYLLSTTDGSLWQLKDPDGISRRANFGPNTDEFTFIGTQGGTSYVFSGAPVAVPEPAAIAILGFAGLAGLACCLRRRSCGMRYASDSADTSDRDCAAANHQSL